MADPLRVLHLYAGNLYGGVERVLATLAAVGAPGMEPSFALAFEGRLAEEIRASGRGVEVIGPVRLARPWTVPAARRRLARLLRRERPEVVVAHSTWAHGLLAAPARRARVPLAFWLHDAVTGRGWADRLARHVRPDLALCTSAFAAATLPRLWPHLRGEVVYPPVPQPDTLSSARASLRAALDAPAGEVVVLQASRMEPWKGHRTLLEALGRLAGAGGWRCWIAGGATRRHERRHLAEMEELARRLGIARRVRFLGERTDMGGLMAAADLFCQPNLGPEPFGIAFVEAMHAGLPLVGAGVGGTLEVVDPSVGVLVPPGDPAALAAALGRLLADPEERARLGAAGPARARALCDPARQAERVRAVLVQPGEGLGG